MSDEVVSFLKELMRRHKRLPSQLSNDLGLCQPTVARWLAGIYVPNTRSCQKLAEYGGVPIEKVLSIAGHLPQVAQTESADWPEFREYAQLKYPKELDEDVISIIENLIQRRRCRV
jgi:transcriptional regulator with XRE-family HTH domain